MVSFYSYKAINNTYVKDAVDKNSYLLQMEKLHINNQIEVMERAVQMAYEDKEVKDYLANTEEPDLVELVDFNTNVFRNITRVQYNNPNIEHLRLYSNSNVHEMWPIIFRESRVASEPWYQKAEKLKGQFSWSFLNSDRDLLERFYGQKPKLVPKVSLLREMSIPEDNHIGMVQVDMLLERFTPKTYTTIQDSQSQMFLVDGEMQLFTRPDHSFSAREQEDGCSNYGSSAIV